MNRTHIALVVLFTVAFVTVAPLARAQTYNAMYYSDGGSYYNSTPTTYYVPTVQPVYSYDPGVPTGNISTDPHHGLPGDQVMVAGSAFPPNRTLTVYFANIPVKQISTNSNGSFQTVVRVPSITPGVIVVSAQGMDPYNPPTFVVDAPKIVYTDPRPYTPYPTYPSYGNSSREAQIAALRTKIADLQSQLSDLVSQLNALTGGRGY